MLGTRKNIRYVKHPLLGKSFIRGNITGSNPNHPQKMGSNTSQSVANHTEEWYHLYASQSQ